MVGQKLDREGREKELSSFIVRFASLNLYRLASFVRIRKLRTDRVISRIIRRSTDYPGFFDNYPEFFSTSKVSATRNRLNLRHRTLIDANEAVIRGQSVLDIASHDGRWSFAALKKGARHVVGIEPRQHLVDFSCSNMAKYGIPNDQFKFICGDVFNVIDKLEPGSIDTVFCFGFLYHTMHHLRLMEKIANLQPRHLILDTEIAPDHESVIRVRAENVSGEGAGWTPSLADKSQTIIGFPSRSALDLMLSSCRWNFSYYNWHGSSIKRWDDLVDYHEGRRVTIVASASPA